jgi:hypothetical protein
LAQCHADRVTGTLRIVGNPGGLFQLCDGAVIAVDSPGSPGADTLLLRSGRISEGDWSEALRGSADTRSCQAALVAQGSVGSTELQVVAMAAMQDGVFATVAGDIDEFVVADEFIDVPLPTSDGVAPDLLLAETARRLDALASLPFPLSPYRERVVPAYGTEPPLLLTAGRREIIAHATGRRNARDIAFAVGRSVYPVTVEISRMLSEDLLEIVPAETSIGSSRWGFTSLRPRGEIERTVDPGVDQVNSLPARRPGPVMSDFRNYLRPSG